MSWFAAGNLAACTGQIPDPPAEVFVHDLGSETTPWTTTAFDDGADQFTFAVFGDLNGGERPGIFEIAVAQLSLLRPALVLSVGDLIDGPTQDVAALSAEWDSFDARAGQATAPIFRAGGNHDLTGQVLRDVWADRYGPRYYHFVYQNVLFLVLDTEDHTDEKMAQLFEARAAALEAIARGEDASGMEYYQLPERVTGNIGPEQATYVTNVLADYPDVRWTMLFMHKPVWTDGQDPDFVAIESALTDRPYTVFNGHLHTLSHSIRNGRDYIMLGTTGGSQSANPMSFDHVTLVTVGDGEPSIAHLRMDGILDKTGVIPHDGSRAVSR